MHRFTRKLTLKRFFSIQEQKHSKNQRIPDPFLAQPRENNDKVGKEINFKGKLSFYPTSSKGNFIETFQEVVLEELEQLTIKKKGKNKDHRKFHSVFF